MTTTSTAPITFSRLSVGRDVQHRPDKVDVRVVHVGRDTDTLAAARELGLGAADSPRALATAQHSDVAAPTGHRRTASAGRALANVRAYRTGCYDPTYSTRLRNEVAAMVGPIRLEFSFNYAPRRSPVGSAQRRAHRAHRGGERRDTLPFAPSGPSFSLVATQNSDLSRTGRVQWEAFDDAALASFLVTVHSLLVAS